MFESKYLDSNWDASNRYRFGIEYEYSKKVSLRAGYYFDESSLPDEAVSITNIIDVNTKNITIGAGYKVNKRQIDITFSYQWGKRIVNGIEYEKKVFCTYFGISK